MLKRFKILTALFVLLSVSACARQGYYRNYGNPVVVETRQPLGYVIEPAYPVYRYRDRTVIQRFHDRPRYPDYRDHYPRRRYSQEAYRKFSKRNRQMDRQRYEPRDKPSRRERFVWDNDSDRRRRDGGNAFRGAEKLGRDYGQRRHDKRFVRRNMNE